MTQRKMRIAALRWIPVNRHNLVQQPALLGSRGLQVPQPLHGSVLSQAGSRHGALLGEIGNRDFRFTNPRSVTEVLSRCAQCRCAQLTTRYEGGYTPRASNLEVARGAVVRPP